MNEGWWGEVLRVAKCNGYTEEQWDAFCRALNENDRDAATLLHPVNWLTEDEFEDIDERYL